MIGGGLAGLSAARDLEDAGASVTVLEARERVGGRVWSLTLTNGAVVELGAEWIMETDRAVLGLAERFELDVVATGADYRRREPWGPGTASLEVQDAFLRSAEATWAELSASERAAMTLGGFLDDVDGDAAARSAVKVRLAGTAAADLTGVALRVADTERPFASDGGTYYRIGRGNGVLPEALASSLADVRTGQVVDAVERDAAGATVHMGPDAERADAVVVAVPAPISARLHHAPELPEELAEALEQLPMGEASKFAVATDEPPSARAVQCSDLSMWCWAANGEDGLPRPCIASFAGSREAQEALDVTSGRIGPWLDRLTSMNPDVEFVGEPVLYAWADDPFTLGAYSAWDNRSWDRRPLFERPVGRLAFAGEHTGGDHYATMEGAVRSGIRAAAQVLQLLD